MQQLNALPAAITLWLHLAACYLPTMGTKSMLAHCLFNSTHGTLNATSASTLISPPTTFTEVTIASSLIPLQVISLNT